MKLDVLVEQKDAAPLCPWATSCRLLQTGTRHNVLTSMYEVQQGKVKGPAHGLGQSQEGWVENGLRAALRRRTSGC